METRSTSIVKDQYLHYWKSVVLWVLGNLLLCLFDAGLPIVIIQVTTALLDESGIDWFRIFVSVGIYSSMLVTYWITGPFLALFGRKTQYKMLKRLRDQLMKKNYSLPISSTSTASSTNDFKVFTDSEQSLNIFWIIPRMIFDFIIPFIIGFYVMFHIDWPIGVFGVLVTIVVLIVNVIFQRKAGVKLNIQRASEQKLLGNTYIDYTKRLEIKTYGSEKHEHNKFKEMSKDTLDSSITSHSLFQVSLSATRIAKGLLFLGPLLFLLSSFSLNYNHYLIHNTIHTETLTLVVNIGLLLSSSSSLSLFLPYFTDMLNALVYSSVGSKRVQEYYSQLSEPQPKGLETPILLGKIEFKNVSFKHKDKYIFKDFNLTIEPGKTVGIIGKTGIGKSTLFKLLLRFYEIEKGDILIDGVSIYNYNLHSYRKSFGLLQQKSVSFSGTIKENIIYNSRPGDISPVLKKVGLQNDVTEFEHGVNTQVEPNGNPLSGGQQQRLSIARLLFSNPSIVLLDEATSSLDHKTEKIIKDSLNSFCKNKTTLIITHKLPTIKGADLIIHLGPSGKIFFRGTWEELLVSKKSKPFPRV